jgi:hypothetical protein
VYYPIDYDIYYPPQQMTVWTALVNALQIYSENPTEEEQQNMKNYILSLNLPFDSNTLQDLHYVIPYKQQLWAFLVTYQNYLQNTYI